MTKTAQFIAIIGLLFLAACGGGSPAGPQMQTVSENQAATTPGSSLAARSAATAGGSKAQADPESKVGEGAQAAVDGEAEREAAASAQTADAGSTPDLAQPEIGEPDAVLFDFEDADIAWFTLDDSVMGGISQSTTNVSAESGLLTFAGTVSLENNGGFASTQSQWQPYDLGLFDGVVLRVRGDGNVYRLRIYTEATGRDIAYTAIFETEADAWTEVYIPFNAMLPLYRGFIVESAGPINPESIRSFGFMIAEKQTGDFKLEVDWIDAVSNRQADSSGARTLNPA